MLSVIRGLGVAGGIGVLIGIGLVFYIRPTENGGVGFLIALPTIICTTIGGIIVALRGKKENGNGKDATDDNDQDDDGSG
jgi:hypothetical protein